MLPCADNDTFALQVTANLFQRIEQKGLPTPLMPPQLFSY